jgi:RluA family pseudouridine synthase
MIELVFEDEYVAVVNKPAGLLTVAAPGKKRNLTTVLSSQLKQEVFPCHRLDEETSGAIIYAKDIEMQHILMRQFKDKEVFKKYVAFVQGRFKRSLVMDQPVKAIGKPPKPAVTKFRAREVFKTFSVVEAIPVTGRSNQIRIHCVQAGHPVVGERKYTVAKQWPISFRRLCLHAEFVSFRHPLSGDRIDLRVPMPEDMKVFLRHLKSTCL